MRPDDDDALEAELELLHSAIAKGVREAAAVSEGERRRERVCMHACVCVCVLLLPALPPLCLTHLCTTRT